MKFLALLLAALPLQAQKAAVPGKLTGELPTLKCLGMRWIVGGDSNANARVTVDYRRAGTTTWRKALPLLRVDRAGMRTPPANGAVLFAGSVFDLSEGTNYEVRLSLSDSDGGSTQRVLRMRTWTERHRPATGNTVVVRPGGLAKALAASKAGDVLELQAGTYRGSFAPRSGTASLPITILGPADRKAILDGGNGSTVLSRSGLQYVIFENLTIQNARYGMAFNEGAYITVRRCTIRDVEYGFVAQRNGIKQKRILIADNIITGRATWPRSKGIESRRGIQLGGQGHVVCYNRISRFADAINTFPAFPTSAIDFYGNDISDCTDDGIEMDGSEHNTRCFDNRLTNVYQGISLQPVHGGPVYVFRNSLYNVVQATFKLNNNPSGGVLYHNTSIKIGMPLVLYSGARVNNTLSRNNLFIGTSGNYAFESTARMINCDYDYDAFGGQWKQFLKWNGVRYKTMAQAKLTGPVYKNAVRIDPARAFQSKLLAPKNSNTRFSSKLNDTRLSTKSAAIDAGVVLPNINDGYSGKAPDLGAHERGKGLPSYGPRPISARIETHGPTPRPGSTVGLALTTEGDGGILYLTGLSLGTGPIAIDSRRFGLSLDPLLLLSISGALGGIFPGFTGKMSATGRAKAAVYLPKLASLVGLTMHTAFLTFDVSSPSGIRSISNTAQFRVNP